MGRKGSYDTVDPDQGKIAGCWSSTKDGCSAFLNFLWDPEEKTVFGRGGKSWAQILLFYAFYYAFLCALFAASISIVLSTLDPFFPRFQTRLQAPGLSIMPRESSSKDLTSDIKYKISDPKSYERYVTIMKEQLLHYSNANQSNPEFFINCTRGPVKINQDFTNDEIAKACVFHTDVLDRCAISPFGYDTGKPCIYLKANKIISWFPVAFNNLDDAVGNDESKAPSLKDVLITNYRQYDPLTMYFSCYGSKEEDSLLLNGASAKVSANTKYFPAGVDFKFFPYYGNKRSPQYRPPFIAVQFTNVTRNKEVKVRCKVYSKNIIDDDRMQVGFMRFNLKIDD